MKTIDCNLQKENVQKFNKKIADLIQSKTGSQFLFSNISYEDKKQLEYFRTQILATFFALKATK